MACLLRLIKRKKIIKKKQNRSFNLFSNPQKKAVCLKSMTLSPKKPNSANRKVAKIRMLESKKILTVKLPGEKNNFQQHSFLLVHGGRTKDLIGVNLKAVKGKYDLSGVIGRKNSRSKYGTKKL